MPHCTYCGDVADTVDHVVPVTKMGVQRRGRKFMGILPYVPACRECNTLLADQAFYTIEARAAYLRERLPKRYAKLLKRPKWTDEELSELGYHLREAILAEAEMASAVRRRLEFLGSVVENEAGKL